MRKIYISLLFILVFLFPESGNAGNAKEISPGTHYTIEEVFTIEQNKATIKGSVTDMKGEPIVGANIVEKGTSNGTTTDSNGNFSLDVGANSDLIITSIGYRPQAIPVNGRTSFTIRMEEEALMLETVIVTAMGITKKESSLTYSTQLINSDELTRTKDPNFINTLAGKSAGMQISRSFSGLGGSVKVSIRGIRSINGNNQPLYVIDGIPMLNSTNENVSTIMGGTADAGNRDGGDGISNLNPDDIESLNILKGVSAAALYGSQAANGVILITTKQGSPDRQQVTFSSNTMFEQAISLPKFQNSYGIDDNNMSWGTQGNLKKYDNAGDFFQNGLTSINSISLSRGNRDMRTYFSYANTSGKGIVNDNHLTKDNLNFRETANLFSNRLNLDANVNLMQQSLKNRPVTGGYYMNPLVGLYTYARGEDMTLYRKEFEAYDIERNMNVQQWYREINSFEQNPYWLRDRILSTDKRVRAIANFTAKIKINNELNIQARATMDYTCDEYKQKIYASTAPEIAGTYIPEGQSKGYANGRYIDQNHKETLLYGDLMAMYNKDWGDLSLNSALGTSFNRTNVSALRLDSKSASLYYPNQFTVANIVMNTNANIEESIDQHRELQSVFGTAQLGWKDYLYLDITARNDWSSTLAYTKNTSFFYPSVGIAWVVNNSFQLPDWVSFAKLRASWGQVGNDLPLFISKLQDRIVAGGAILANDRAPFGDLKPELSTSYEVGAEGRFFNQRFEIDFTYYNTSTRNQLLTLPNPVGAPFKFSMVNAGKITNKGFEIILGATPVIASGFRWKTTINYSSNKNKIVKLHPALRSYIYGEEGFSMNYAMRLEPGGSFGDIYGWKFQRDETGKIAVNEKGLPLSVGDKNTEKVGNSMPNYMLGWSNTLAYRGFYLYFLIDSRVGGDVLSMTQPELDYNGVSKATAIAREKGYVEVDGQKFTDVPGFYKSVGSRNTCVTEYYMYSATNVRLRELSIGYSIPRSILEKTHIFSGIDLSLIGRNLFFLYKDAPFDPDAVMSTGNSLQGVDVFGIPSTRSIGFNIKLTL